MRTEDRRSNPHKSNWRSEFFNKLLVLCPGNTLTKSLEFSEDGIRGGGPGERPGVGVVVMNEAFDIGHQFPDTAEGSAADPFYVYYLDLILHVIKPGKIGRVKVQVVSGGSRQPASDARMFV